MMYNLHENIPVSVTDAAQDKIFATKNVIIVCGSVVLSE